MATPQKVKIQGTFGTVSGLLDSPNKVLAGLTLAHGAGAGMNHPFMVDLAMALKSVGFSVLRFQFPYMEAGKKRTDSQKIATATVAAAVRTLQKMVKTPTFAGGKSFGARMTTTAASEGLLTGLNGIICFGFPLHAVGKPSLVRAAHLNQLPCRTLFLQGTRDELAPIKDMRKVCSKLPKATLHSVEGADHGFNVLKRSGRTSQEVIDEIVKATQTFCLSARIS